MTIHKNQSGIAHLAAILIIVLITGLGFAGWRVYMVQKENNNLKQKVSGTNKETNNKSVSTAGKYENSEFGFKLSFPESWGQAVFGKGKVSGPNHGEFYELTFPNHKELVIDFVTKGYTSPIDGCGLPPLESEEFGLSATKTKVIGWEGNNLKMLLSPDQGNDTERIVSSAIGPGPYGGAGTEKLKVDNKVLVYKDVDQQYWKAAKADDNPNGCGDVTQSEADQANAYRKFIHYAVNYNGGKVRGTNAHYDARKSFDQSLSDQLVEVLNTIKAP